MLEFNAITFQKLSYLEKYFDDPVSGIPATSGIYYWVHYPEFDPDVISVDNLVDKLDFFCKKNLRYTEDLKGKYKFLAEIKEQGFPDSGELFGLSPTKSQTLKNFLSVSKTNISTFHRFFIEVCFTRPFYVGKADNLRNRIAKKHFKRHDSEILNEIDRQSINYSDVWIGYKEIPALSTGEAINVIFEEILSRTVKPGLTKKPN